MPDVARAYVLWPFLRVRFAPDKLVLEHFFRHTDIALCGKNAYDLIQFLRKPHRLEEIEGSGLLSLPDVQELRDGGFIVSVNDRLMLEMKGAYERWRSHNWDDAFYFHFATRDYPFLDYADTESAITDRQMMERYVANEAPPQNYKTYARERITLPRFDGTRAMRSIRDAAQLFNSSPRRAVNLDDLSFLLFCAAGKIGTKAWPGQGEFLRKTVPSGGARHPTEVYCVAFDIAGLAPGIYHYNVEHAALDSIDTGSSRQRLLEESRAAVADLEDRLQFEPSALFVMTSVVQRSMWRYRDSRSYRVILLDVGHVVMNLRLACEVRDLPYFVGQGFSDRAVAQMLGVDSMLEIPLLVAAV